MKKYLSNLCVMLAVMVPIIGLAQEWVARYDGPVSSDDGANAIALDHAGNVYVTGESVGSGTYRDYATVKYDASGAEQWVTRYNGSGNDDDGVYGIAVDNTGTIYVTGYSYGFGTYADYLTVKYDSLGVEQWVARYNGPGSENDGARAIAIDNAGNICVTGSSYGSGTSMDYATIKYLSTGIATERETSVESSYFGPTILTGPMLLPEDGKCRIFDITGRVVVPDEIRPGIYFIEIDGQIIQKVIKIK